jgi:hypothetical protein
MSEAARESVAILIASLPLISLVTEYIPIINTHCQKGSMVAETYLFVKSRDSTSRSTTSS